jgi:DNA-binding MarR family transcriptional regulator
LFIVPEHHSHLAVSDEGFLDAEAGSSLTFALYLVSRVKEEVVDERQFGQIMTQVIPYLTPPEQSIYFRLWYESENLLTRLRYDDLARQCHLSLSAVQRVIKSLRARKLLQTSWDRNHATTFTLHIVPQTPKAIPFPTTAMIYDHFTPEDRALFLVGKRSLSQADLTALEAEAAALVDPTLLRDKLNELIMRRIFGPERQKKYGTLFLHLYRSI